MKYKNYFFDFDYTLVNSEKGIVMCFVEAMKGLGYPVRPYDEIKATIGMPIEDAVVLLTGEKEPAKVEEYVSLYRKLANKYMTPNTHFYPDTLETLRRIKADGGRVAIVTTKTHFRVMEKLIKDNCADLVDTIVGREDISTCKPNPDGIFLALGRLDGRRCETIYIGDSLYDAGAARNAGVAFAAVLTGVTKAEEFTEYNPVQVMECLSELK